LFGCYNPTGSITFTLKYNGSTVYTDHVTVGSGTDVHDRGRDNPGATRCRAWGTVNGLVCVDCVLRRDGNNTPRPIRHQRLEQVMSTSASPDLVTTADPNGTVTLDDGWLARS